MTLLLCFAALFIIVGAAVRSLILENRRLEKMALEVKTRKV